MRYLCDTQIIIWTLISPEKLTEQTKHILQNNEIFVSQISLFEIAIKQKIGKLPELPLPIKLLTEQIEQDNFTILAINTNHRDPFDRLLLATAISENMPIISSDENFVYYQEQVQLIKN